MSHSGRTVTFSALFSILTAHGDLGLPPIEAPEFGEEIMMKLRTMLRKEPVREAFGNTRGGSRGWDGSAHVANTVGAGLTAGTQVATALGWSNVEDVKVGEKVLTFDEGLQTVQAIETTWVFTETRHLPEAQMPLRVPAGALGNRSELLLMPEQAVMVESDLGEKLFGDPFTLVPALALEGYKGIERVMPRGPVRVVALRFETEQVVFANVGALFFCPTGEEILASGLFDEDFTPGYTVLTLSQARMFVDTMLDEDYQDAVWMAAEKEARARPLYAVN